MSENLILYGKSITIAETESLKLLSEQLNDCDIVLMEDASIGAVSKKELSLSSKNLYCMIEDLEARGFSKSQMLEQVKPITYTDLIDLIESTKRVISLL